MERIIQIGNLFPDTDKFKNRTAGRVYSAEGLCPTINTCQGGGKIPMIMLMKTRTINALLSNPPTQPGVYVFDASFGKAKYYNDVSMTIQSESEDSGNIGVIYVDDMANQRLDKMIEKGIIPNIGGVWVDAYNKSVNTEIAGTITTRIDAANNTFVTVPEETKKGYAEAYCGDSVNLSNINSKTRRGRVGKQIANTLDTGCQMGVVTLALQIRKLTPRECFRLMGVEDRDIDIIQGAGISNSQQYKMACNSIVVDTLYHIFDKLFVHKSCDGGQLNLF